MTRTLELLDRLVGFPTVSSDSNLALIDWTEAFLRGIGADVHRIYDATGLKAGLFGSIDEISAQWARDARFEPKMNQAARDALLAGWRQAVERTLR